MDWLLGNDDADNCPQSTNHVWLLILVNAVVWLQVVRIDWLLNDDNTDNYYQPVHKWTWVLVYATLQPQGVRMIPLFRASGIEDTLAPCTCSKLITTACSPTTLATVCKLPFSSNFCWTLSSSHHY